MNQDFRITIARSPKDVADVKAIFQEYAAFLNVDLCFQGFDREMATFPAAYDFLLIGKINSAAAGAVGLKDLGGRTCEMKRLYVRPAYQKCGLGRMLVLRLIEEARARGYRKMLLDTLPQLNAAIALYRELGFAEIERYYDNPLPGVLYMALDFDTKAPA